MKLNRARQNAGKKSASAQSATAPKIAQGKPPEDKVFLRIFYERGETVTNMDEFSLPPDLAAFFRAEEERPAYRLPEFITQALQAKLARDKSPFSVAAFEGVINRTLLAIDAMNCKLLSHFEIQMHWKSPEYDAQIAATICAYQEAALTAAKDLHAQFEMVCAFVQAKNGN